jgi:hypothetical protein
MERTQQELEGVHWMEGKDSPKLRRTLEGGHRLNSKNLGGLEGVQDSPTVTRSALEGG